MRYLTDFAADRWPKTRDFFLALDNTSLFTQALKLIHTGELSCPIVIILIMDEAKSLPRLWSNP